VRVSDAQIDGSNFGSVDGVAGEPFINVIHHWDHSCKIGCST